MEPPRSRILVVDDNDALRENLAETLEIEGYPVAVAGDGASALEKLSEDPPPGIVLLDLMMPGMSGAELLARIRAESRLRHVKVVVTSGVTGAAARVTDADAVLTKPFGVKELLEALQKLGA